MTTSSSSRSALEVDVPSLTDALAAALRQRILSGEIEPGWRITEQWVASTFSVARPTAKAGLERLLSQGLLQRAARKSAVVPRFHRTDIEDIYFSRSAVEIAAVRTLAGSVHDVSNAERALRAMAQATRDSNYVEHIEADIAFHRGLLIATKSPRLVRMHELIMGEVQLCIAQVQASEGIDLVEILDDHSSILTAIQSQKVEIALEALQHDLYGARDRLLSRLQE